VITDAQGIPTLLRPIAQFDLDDGILGLHPVDINGVKFDLGTDSGLRHSYVDTNVVNGQRYFYAVTAYDFGFEFGNISPTETAIQVDVSPEGDVTVGTNVAVVRPRPAVAGYLPAEVTELEHPSGSSTGLIGFNIVDPRVIEDGHVYEITFEDTVVAGPTFDILTTKNFTVRDVTENVIELENSTLFNEGDEVPLIDGFRLSFVNEERVRINQVLSQWSDPTIYSFQFSPVQFLTINGQQRPADYRFVFGEVGVATSVDTSISFLPLPSKEVNFQIFNLSENREVAFAFAEIDGNDGRFTIDPNDANRTDTIYLLEPNDEGQLTWTWQMTMNIIPRNGRNPMAGDTLNIFLRKPFLSRDVYRFTMEGEGVDAQLAKNQLDDIRVVPNPYVAAASWEPRNTFSSGRGPRELHFINLPQNCKIRIFNVNGVLIDTIEHNSVLDNGTAIWDMLSKDNLDISYGIYVYHIEAPGVGEKTGTFAVIK